MPSAPEAVSDQSHQSATGSAPVQVGLVRLGAEWFRIGVQSFGGGSSMLLLIQRSFVERLRWIRPDEFRLFWTIALMAPGINLIAIAALFGRHLRGYRGVIVSFVGMLVPCSAITCLLAAGYVAVERSSVVPAAVRGIVPATAAMLLLVAATFVPSLVQGVSKAGRLGWLRTPALFLISLGCAGAISFGRLNVPAVIVVSVLAGIIVFKPADQALDRVDR